jgi:CBS domain-containing protein
LATEPDIVRGTFETDPIKALGLPSPVSIGTHATVGEALAAVQTHKQGYVLVVQNERPVGIMTERDVLMKIVARNIRYDTNVADFVSQIPGSLTESDTIAKGIALMLDRSADNIPVVDAAGKVTAVLRTLDVIHFLAQAFPEQLLNLPPNPHQTLPKPEGG